MLQAVFSKWEKPISFFVFIFSDICIVHVSVSELVTMYTYTHIIIQYKQLDVYYIGPGLVLWGHIR